MLTTEGLVAFWASRSRLRIKEARRTRAVEATLTGFAALGLDRARYAAGNWLPCQPRRNPPCWRFFTHGSRSLVWCAFGAETLAFVG